MRIAWLFLGLLVLLVAAGVAAAAPSEPTNVAVIDVPNDDGTGLGVLWDWSSEPSPDACLVFEIKIPQEMIDYYTLTDQQQESLQAARAELSEQLKPLVAARTTAHQEATDAHDAFQIAEANHKPETAELRREYYKKKVVEDNINEKINKAKDRFTSRIKFRNSTLLEESHIHDCLEATSRQIGWLATDATVLENEVEPVAKSPDRFGNHPANPDKRYVEIHNVKAAHPAFLNGSFDAASQAEMDSIDEQLNDVLTVDLRPGMQYQVRMLIVEGPKRYHFAAKDLYSNDGLAKLGATVTGEFDLGSARTAVNYFDVSKLNNLIFAVVFAIIILTWIMIARRNPNIFIRRIQGLEAVDEAIGRATEMGKPALYLCGLDPLSSLSTIAAVNILGRVARHIAEYDSDLVVPCRDPVVLTVAQEVAKEAYIDAGRPDAYREDNIYFVTDDQFSYTATTCAIMMRDKPAANFFMGYYYAESLLLAETGAASGAIQIAGTDALPQLPFFITTCDYTLIGEELYAASAYLSREPMLLGSLKGQDISKAVVMLIILMQTIFFIFSDKLNWLVTLVKPL